MFAAFLLGKVAGNLLSCRRSQRMIAQDSLRLVNPVGPGLSADCLLSTFAMLEVEERSSPTSSRLTENLRQQRLIMVIALFIGTST